MNLHDPITPPKFPYVQKVLPAVYDDSLSYYELLTKMEHYLDEVVGGYNSLYDAMVLLNKAWEDFESGGYLDSFNEFIEKWFEDNQAYINEMLEEGFGGEIERLDAKIDTTAENVLDEVGDDYVPFPVSPLSKFGTSGQVLSTLADGTTEWQNPVVPSDAQAEQIITEWLNDHPEATTTVQNGAITDAKINSGSSIILNKGYAHRLSYTSCDDITSQGVYYVSATAGVPTISDYPFSGAGTLLVLSNGTLITQVASCGVNMVDDVIHKVRCKAGAGAWSAWKSMADNTNVAADLANAVAPLANFKLTVPAQSSCDDLTDNGVYFCSSRGGTVNPSDFPFTYPGFLLVFSWSNSVKMQTAYNYNNDKMYTRKYVSGTWSDWQVANASVFDTKYFQNNITAGSTASCDNVTACGIFFVSSSGGVTNPPDFPLNSIGWLINEKHSSTSPIQFQIALPYYPSEHKGMFRARHADGNWSNWQSLATQTTNTITREVSNDTYNQTFNITTSPTITTDSNGWLQSVDTDVADETNVTDMTGSIMSMLTDTGYCHLSEGIFYVSGGIVMPEGSTLVGCGNKTIVRLLQSTTSGYIVRPVRYSTIRDIRFSGGRSDIDVSSGNIGGRQGLRYVGNRNGQHPEVTPSSGKFNIIEGCRFEHFDSAIYGYNNGGDIDDGIIVNNCYINNCVAGINLDYSVEYSKFNNVVTRRCYYACINNGGNNVFMNCIFHGTIGMMMDNSGNDKVNQGHGSVIGCTFNHTDNWNHPEVLGNGLGIYILGITNGFIFNSCQIFYSEIHVEDSTGIQFSDCLFKGGTNSKLTVDSDKPVIFANDVFLTAPSMDVTQNTVFDNCRNASNGALVTL